MEDAGGEHHAIVGVASRIRSITESDQQRERVAAEQLVGGVVLRDVEVGTPQMVP